MASNTPKKQRPSTQEIFLSDTVIVTIGAEAQKYRVHEALLMHHSGYFRGALEPVFPEKFRTMVLTFRDIKTYTFVNFLKWLYFERLPDDYHHNYDWDWEISPGGTIAEAMISLYILADCFVVSELTKCVSGELCKHFHSHPPQHDVTALAFDWLPADSPILRLFVDAYCLYWDPKDDDIEQNGTQYLPVEFYKRLALRFAATRDGGLKMLECLKYAEPDIKGVGSGEQPREKKRKTKV